MALNRFNGKLVWRAYMLDPAVPVRKNAIGVQLWGPSGASIWSSPALDPERNRMYVTTGDKLFRPGLADERCGRGSRSAHWGGLMVEAIYAQRCLERGL